MQMVSDRAMPTVLRWFDAGFVETVKERNFSILVLPG